jgi:hypothetical protein
MELQFLPNAITMQRFAWLQVGIDEHAGHDSISAHAHALLRDHAWQPGNVRLDV